MDAGSLWTDDGAPGGSDPGDGDGSMNSDAGMPPVLDFSCEPRGDIDAGLDDPDAAVQAPCGSLRLEYRASDTDVADNQIKPHFNVVSEADMVIDLGALTLRYWYTVEGQQQQEFHCDYAQIGCDSVQGSFHQTAASGADHYLEVGFTSGTLAPGAETGEIQARINKLDWSEYDESDDYSFDPTHTTFAEWPRVTMYYGSMLIWGTEP